MTCSWSSIRRQAPDRQYMQSEPSRPRPGGPNKQFTPHFYRPCAVVYFHCVSIIFSASTLHFVFSACKLYLLFGRCVRASSRVVRLHIVLVLGRFLSISFQAVRLHLVFVLGRFLSVLPHVLTQRGVLMSTGQTAAAVPQLEAIGARARHCQKTNTRIHWIENRACMEQIAGAY